MRMGHMDHEAGTFAECEECQDVAYEPGWYALLRRISDPSEARELWLVTPAPEEQDFSDTF
jgi:hypothetical protein